MTDPSRDPRMPSRIAAGPDEKTTVLPETATALVELERIQNELAAAEERAKNHWDQYLRRWPTWTTSASAAARSRDTRQFAVEKFAGDSSR